jgi:nucleotide-binding universal stress UspA family protein
MTVVLGYISTPEGEAALGQALTEACLREVELVVVNTSRRDAYVDDRHVQDADWRALEDRVRSTGLAFQVIRPHSSEDVATALIDVVEEHEAQVLVIGLRQRSAVGKLLMGSTAQRLLLQAPCPVLAVKS